MENKRKAGEEVKITAIICEYNPFHKGHEYHIHKIKEAYPLDNVVAIMSGNFVQRGDTAVFDKQTRAKAAILGGADLVLELPTPYSLSSAEFFALGGIKILNALGMPYTLSFGAETPNKDMLLNVARLLANEPAEFKEALQTELSSGKSYPQARANAAKAILGENVAEFLANPNNILGVEYIKAIIKTNSPADFFPVGRNGAEHDSMSDSEGFASASLIRNKIATNEDYFAFCPQSAIEHFKDASIHSIKVLDPSILGHIIKMNPEELRKVPDVSEGLENRILAAAMEVSSVDELIEKVKTKRYTHSRIRRILLSAYLGIKKESRTADPLYINILAHNEKGQKVIAAAKKTATLPLVRNTSQVNKLKDEKIKALWEQQRIYDKIYELSKI